MDGTISLYGFAMSVCILSVSILPDMLRQDRSSWDNDGPGTWTCTKGQARTEETLLSYITPARLNCLRWWLQCSGDASTFAAAIYFAIIYVMRCGGSMESRCAMLCDVGSCHGTRRYLQGTKSIRST